MDYSFPKAFRLCKRKEFLLVSKEKKSALGRFIIADIRKLSEELPPRLGITASRKFGKSHERNRFKRLVREAFRHSAHSLPRGLEIVIKPRTFAKNASFQDILQELIKLVQ